MSATTLNGNKIKVLKQHPEALCVLDRFPGMEGYRVWWHTQELKDWRTCWRTSYLPKRYISSAGMAFKSPADAWSDAAKRVEAEALP